jgi:hypothetical protein
LGGLVARWFAEVLKLRDLGRSLPGLHELVAIYASVPDVNGPRRIASADLAPPALAQEAVVGVCRCQFLLKPPVDAAHQAAL